MAAPDSLRKISSISAVFPAYNDYATISSMVVTVILALRKVTDDFEVIVTNDGSQDDTGRVLDEMAQHFPELRVFHHSHNRGYGGALRTGFSAATKEWVFYTDGDAQYNPLELSVLVGALKPGIDVVNGYKISRKDNLLRIIIGRLYHYSVKIAFGLQIRDVDCDFRLIRRELFDHIFLESESGTICVEMVKKFQKAGYQFAEVPVHHYPRPHGVSQFFHVRHLLQTGKDLISLWKKLILHHG